jgi:uroporphyrinogen decarboxylase
MEMTRRERIKAALKGEKVDRIPVAFWRHWPIDDQGAESLARCALDFYYRFDFDFIKIPPSYTYITEDYGTKHEYRAGQISGLSFGERDFTERVVKKPEDWERIEPLNVSKGAYGRQLQCLRIVLGKRKPDTPVIHTMFNPLALAQQLAGEEMLLVHLRRYPQKVEWALTALTETCAIFAAAVIKEGADGIFMSTNTASFELMSAEEYQHFGRPGDLKVLAAAKGGWFNALHLHGKHPMFALLADYPVQAMNWHDRTAGPSLAEASKLFTGAVMAGVDQNGTLHLGTPADVEAQVHDAIKQMNGCRLIVAGGCTYPLTVPEGNLRAARKAVETFTKK